MTPIPASEEVTIAYDVSRATLLAGNESLRDELARLRVLADVPQLDPSRTEDLRAFCRTYCDTLLADQDHKRIHLYPEARALTSSQDEIGAQIARVRRTAELLTGLETTTADLRQHLDQLSALLENHLSAEENHLFP